MTTKARRLEITRYRIRVSRRYRRRIIRLDTLIAKQHAGGLLMWLRRLFGLNR